jgi:alpha-ketoglutarate-dependent taurine dioxygenase
VVDCRQAGLGRSSASAGQELLRRLRRRDGTWDWLSVDLTYRHRCSPGRLIARDNRSLLHGATSCDPNARRRVIRRCTVPGEVPA